MDSPAVRAKTRKQIRTDEITARAIDSNNFSAYEFGIVHEWLRTTTALAFTLVPMFFVLDIFTLPEPLLPTFAIYRAASAVLALVQYLIVRSTKPTRWSYLHGYLVTLQVGGMIALMTTYLGGFTSSYYAGLNLVVIGVNLLMPWKSYHTAANASMIIFLYLILNFATGHTFSSITPVNNLFFLVATSLIAVAINEVRHRLIRNEFGLLVELKRARDALWSEMELAKQIQFALLPENRRLKGFDISVTMLPAKEVGGDYYDFVETENGERFVAIGDVSGHGVDSGLIMMMAQTAIMTLVRSDSEISPTSILNVTNRVLRENISRLESNHYMTLSILRLEDDSITVAGHHQDVLVYRYDTGKVTAVATKGTWLGIADDVSEHIETTTLPLGKNDVMLLFTDGVTETTNINGEMYGQERLQEVFRRYSSRPLNEALEGIVEDVQRFQTNQDDDITIMLLKRKDEKWNADEDENVRA